MYNPYPKYQDALAEFNHGNTWAGLPNLTWWAAICDKTDEDVIADAEAKGIHSRNADIRRCMEWARQTIQNRSSTTSFTKKWHRKRQMATKKPQPREFTNYVHDCIDRGKAAGVDSSKALRHLSPVDVRGMDPLTAREAQLAAMFQPLDMVHICVNPQESSHATPQIVGETLMTVAEWCDSTNADRLMDAGTLVKANPYTGKCGDNSNGESSLIANSCVARYRNMLLECDDLPLQEQCSLWAGVILSKSPLPIVALVYSGGKSIHAVWRVDVADRAGFDKRKSDALRLFCADPDPKYRIDRQTLDPIHGVRLAGSRRPKTGRMQALLYLNPNLVMVATK